MEGNQTTIVLPACGTPCGGPQSLARFLGFCNMRKWNLLLVAALVAVWSVWSAAQSLNVGDAAPKLQPAQWIKGEPVKEFEKGKVYVVEFWATWCGPCLQSIPHMTELQKKYADKNLTVIGQDCWEENLADVVPFVAKMGEKMAYRVAMDDATGQKGKMAMAWMEAAGRDGIPTAFLIDQNGLVAWIGHPMAIDKVLDQVIGGTYDVKAMAERERVLRRIQNELQAPLKAGQWDKVLQVVDDTIKANPSLEGPLTELKFKILLEKEDFAAAFKLGDTVYEAIKDDVAKLNNYAWGITTDPMFTKRDLDLALKFAVRATEASEGKDADVLDTLARVYAEKGQLDKAVETETRAVEAASSPEEKASYTKTLKGYKDQQGGASK
jgi:thiol-disulfide isomerase/thioredoxin